MNKQKTRKILSLPKDTQNIITNFEIENFNLKWNKNPNIKIEQNKIKISFQKGKKNISFRKQDEYKQYYKRTFNFIKDLNIEFNTLILKPKWRLVIGLGNESIYETSMTLHHIYGIPYISGSAIKGVTRSFIINENYNGKEENALLKDSIFCDIFGCPKKSVYKENRRGKIIFFDAFPIEDVKFELDVMTPHYQPYYSDPSKNPPADYYNPIPINFLTISKTKFKFIIGIKKKDNTLINNNQYNGTTLLNITNDFLIKTLTEYGIGAKTAVGYGFMEKI
ncbi:MAG: type III-B CRISPR module RAMP protein Cmr6 [Candidatus Lokiarchaeota archaeon]|nr:type III-B CRISPR module RAMP protein Cmr6 [Candidatus Harpocratesius repetitus]